MTWDNQPNVWRQREKSNHSRVKTYGDLIRRHRDEHAVEWLTGAVKMMQETGDLQQVLQRYLRLETLSA